MHSIAWCFSDKNLLEQMAEVERALEAPENLRFSSDKGFTHWLFRQPRGAVAPSFVLVIGWREAKLCMAAIKAARTGETHRLRPDSTWPPLVAASPAGLLHVNVAIGAMVVVTTKAEQREKATEWAHSGECDEFVAVRVACGQRDVEEFVRSFSGPQPQQQQQQQQQPPPALPTLLRHQQPQQKQQQQQQQHQPMLPVLLQPMVPTLLQHQQQQQQPMVPMLHQQQQPVACLGPQLAPAQLAITSQGSSGSGHWASAQPDITSARSSRLRSPSPNYMWPVFARAPAMPSCPSRSRAPSHHDEVADSRRSPSRSSIPSNASNASDGCLSSGLASSRGRPACAGSDDFAAVSRSPSPDYMWHGFHHLRGIAAAAEMSSEWESFSSGSSAGFQPPSQALLVSPSWSHRGF